MKYKILLPVWFVFFLTGNQLFAQGTAFTYQGRLNDNGSLANGNYDLAFSLFADSSGGSSISGVVTNSPTFVTNGLFTVTLDFGDVFDGSSRWLQIYVRPYGNSSSYTALSPRQPLNPTPYAIYSGNANVAVTISGSLPNGGFAGIYTNTVSLTSGSNSFTGSFSGNGQGLSNVIALTITGILPSGGLAGTYTNTLSLTSESNSITGYFKGNGQGLTNVPGGFLVWRIYDSTNLFALANTGYLLTSSNFVTVTLPDSTNISDIVRVAATGPGGWKIVCRPNQNFFVNNLAGTIGYGWQPVASSQNWQSIACSADGTRLIAAFNGNSGDVYTSTDSGATWDAHSRNLNLVSVASSASGSRLASGAGSPNGQLYTSADSGATWLVGANPGNWLSIASSADGSKLVACNYGGQLKTSVNYGTNWVARDSSRNWYAAASSADGNKLVAVVNTGNIYTSINAGTNWTSRASSLAWTGVASSADGSKLAACVYGGQIWTSINSGTNWTARETSRNWSSIASSADGSKLVATVFNGGIYISGDSGVSWTTHSPTNNWQAVCSSDDGTKLAAAVNGGQIYISSPSFNVTTSGYITGGQGSAIELLSVGNGQFVPISFMGQIFAY